MLSCCKEVLYGGSIKFISCKFKICSISVLKRLILNWIIALLFDLVRDTCRIYNGMESHNRIQFDRCPIND